MNSLQVETLITERELCEKLRIGAATAARWRYEGRGPRFVALGSHRVGYRPSAVNEWLVARETQQGVAKNIEKVALSAKRVAEITSNIINAA